MNTFTYEQAASPSNPLVEIGLLEWWDFGATPGKPSGVGDTSTSFSLSVTNGSVVFGGSFSYADPTPGSPEFGEGTTGNVTSISFLDTSGSTVMHWAGSGIDYIDIENIYSLAALLGRPFDDNDAEGIDAIIFGTTVEVVGSNFADVGAADPGDTHTVYRLRGGADQFSGNGTDEKISGGSGGDTLSGKDGKDSISGNSGKDTISGGRGADSIFGGGGADVLDGGVGNDYLVDGKGKDLLTGGSNSDIFRFKVDGQTDEILDFEDGKDRINLKDFGTSFADLTFTDLAPGQVEMSVFGFTEKFILRDTASVLDSSAFTAADFIF